MLAIVLTKENVNSWSPFWKNMKARTKSAIAKDRKEETKLEGVRGTKRLGQWMGINVVIFRQLPMLLAKFKFQTDLQKTG